MREELLGYLLGALEPDEMQRVAEALESDAGLRAELDQLKAALRPLEEAHQFFEPPSDLVSRAMAAIPEGQPKSTTVDQEPGHPQPAGYGLSTSPAERRAGGWRGADVFATTAAALLLAGLVLPSILRERATARSIGCQSQLRQAGFALVEFLQRSADRRFPQLAVDGPEAFAGRYAVALGEAGLMPGNSPLWCPAREVPDGWLGRRLPRRNDLYLASPIELAVYQRGAGGHYAYTLGIHERGRYVAPRFAARPHFAILGDAPIPTLGGFETPHEGRGFNILFEDGHVRFVAESAALILGDHPFLNRSGQVEAGLDPNDATLAPSETPPFFQLIR